MPAPSNARLRRLWLNIHLWPGIALALLLVAIGLSGSLLVWPDHLDALVHLSRYAATPGSPLPSVTLMAAAAEKAGSEFKPWVIRFPEADGWPVVVAVREARTERGARPHMLSVYLDPPTGRVLDVVNTRNSLIGFLHRFHENLTIPEYSGSATKTAQLTGDRIASWIRWIHEGSNAGAVWQFLVFTSGLLPALFTVTGIMIWLRSRRIQRGAVGRTAGLLQLDAAE